MVHRDPSLLRRRSTLALGVFLSLLSTGCIPAVADAAAAGALNFIQGSVSTLLSNVIFGDNATLGMEEMGMDGTMMSGGAHEGHDG